jgi:hypothetical protein
LTKCYTGRRLEHLRYCCGEVAESRSFPYVVKMAAGNDVSVSVTQLPVVKSRDFPSPVKAKIVRCEHLPGCQQ